MITPFEEIPLGWTHSPDLGTFIPVFLADGSFEERRTFTQEFNGSRCGRRGLTGSSRLGTSADGGLCTIGSEGRDALNNIRKHHTSSRFDSGCWNFEARAGSDCEYPSFAVSSRWVLVLIAWPLRSS